MRSKKLRKTLIAMGIGLMVMSGGASAAVSFFAPVTGFEDDNLDQFINVDGSVDANGNPTLTVGDRLVSVLKYNLSFGVFGGGPTGFGTDELTAISDITVTSKVADGNLFDFTFGPTVGGLFGNADNNGGSAGAGTGVMASVFLDPTPDLQVVPPDCNGAGAGAGTFADCVTNASNGALWLSVGFTGDVNESWDANDATDLPLGLLGVSASTKVGALNYYLNIITNNTGMNLIAQQCDLLPAPLGCAPGGDGKVDLIGSGDLLGGQGLPASLTGDGVVARSDTDFQVAVPEPGMLALLAAALLGFGAVRPRRRNA